MNSIWYHHNPLCYLLYPFSIFYRIIIAVRRFFYRIGIFKSHRLNAPVIVVGNITVGGTGKTPLVIALTDELKKQGLHPGIVLRGYRGKSKTWPQLVNANSDPIVVGDEAVLLSEKTNVPVMAGPDRVASAKKLIAENNCNVIISDDGLQHYALARDIEIAVVDASRRFGNAWCLPAGPLREPISRLQSVDFIVSNGEALPVRCQANFVRPARVAVTKPRSHSPVKASASRCNALALTCELLRELCREIATGQNYADNVPGEFEMQFVIDDIENLCDPNKKINVSDCGNKKIIAIAGIGNPDRFFETLRALNLSFQTKIFSDHYSFQRKDFDALDTDIILMTEKDAIKCRDFADARFYVVRGHVVVSHDFFDAIQHKLFQEAK